MKDRVCAIQRLQVASVVQSLCVRLLLEVDISCSYTKLLYMPLLLLGTIIQRQSIFNL